MARTNKYVEEMISIALDNLWQSALIIGSLRTAEMILIISRAAKIFRPGSATLFTIFHIYLRRAMPI